MQHFFRSVPFAPYAYSIYPDGAAVGLYSPAYKHVWKEHQHVTKDRFMDTRLPGNKTDPIFKQTQYPRCTHQGRAYCDVATRAAARGGKSLLTDKQAKYLRL